MMNDYIYQHYRPEEEAVINRFLDGLSYADQTYAPYLTAFLTPREHVILCQLAGRYDRLSLESFGGYAGAERQRILVCPQYFTAQVDDFQIQAVNIHYPIKFADLTHGKILGTLMSTGIDREMVGDIITDGQSWHLLCDAKIARYFIANVVKVANVGVRLEPISLDQLLTSSETWEHIQVVASSRRLDTLIGKVYNFSRQRAKNMIKSGYVKVNFRQVERPDMMMDVKDIVSVRKYGRFWIDNLEGVTKKDNIRLSIRKLIH